MTKTHLIILTIAGACFAAILPFSYDGAMLVAGLALLVFGADWLVEGAVGLAMRLGISSFVVGLTVVAFGTSAPELAASVQASWRGEGALAVGNVVGSNIANVCLILGLTALIRPVPIKSSVIAKDVPVMIGVTALGIFVMMTGGVITRLEGGILTLGIVVYSGVFYLVGRRESGEILAQLEQQIGEFLGSVDEAVPKSMVVCVVLVLVGALALAGGSSLMVDSATSLALHLGISSEVVGLTMVAFGTSVPELVTSLTAAVKEESDIAVGNILGSNAFNILSVLGIAAIVSPLEVPAITIHRDVWVMLAVAIMCFPVMGSWRRITRWEGAALFLFYLGYISVVYLHETG